MVAVVPELGAMGWVADPLKKLEKVFMHTLATDASQSNEYISSIVSIPFIIANYQHIPNRLAEELTAAYKEVLGRYFTTVNPKIKYNDIKDTNKYDLYISIDVQLDGKTYSLTRVFDLENGKLVRLLSEINA